MSKRAMFGWISGGLSQGRDPGQGGVRAGEGPQRIRESVGVSGGLRVGVCAVLVAGVVAQGAGAGVAAVRAGDTAGSASGKDLVQKMLAGEEAEAQHRGHYLYLSEERSERTGGRLWTERVAETSAGKVRRLIAEDGQPLSAERASGESAKLAEIAADPEAFRRKSEALKNDELHAKQMLGLMTKAFLFDEVRKEGEYVRVDYKPNPDYTPQNMEERVLHAMVGTMLVDVKSSRLHQLEGRLPVDVNIGFGLLATIRAGSNFKTVRDPVPGSEWKTSMLDTDINGRAIFFKAIGKKAHAEHRDFVPLGPEVSVAQAVGMLQR